MSLKKMWNRVIEAEEGAMYLVAGLGILGVSMTQRYLGPETRQAYADTAACVEKIEAGQGCSFQEQKARILQDGNRDLIDLGVLFASLGAVRVGADRKRRRDEERIKQLSDELEASRKKGPAPGP